VRNKQKQELHGRLTTASSVAPQMMVSYSIRMPSEMVDEFCQIVDRRNNVTPLQNDRMSITGVMTQITRNWIIDNRENSLPFSPKPMIKRDI
jgi:hypothetical protein